jgi:hypothetical protein
VTRAHASDSTAQRSAEAIALATLSQEVGVELAAAKVPLPTGERVELDGFAPGPPAILVEVFAHIGPMRGGQPHKVMSDALKLATAAKLLHAARWARPILLLIDEDAAKKLRSGWRRAALEAFAIEVRVVALPPETREAVRAAQARQRMTNVKEV